MLYSYKWIWLVENKQSNTKAENSPVGPSMINVQLLHFPILKNYLAYVGMSFAERCL